MKLLAISSPAFFPGEANIIDNLFRAGLTCLHLRKPEGTKDNFIRLLDGIAPDFHNRIAIHQHHDLAHAFGVKRLHFTESTRKKAAQDCIGTLHEQGYTMSTSIHDLAELALVSTFFDYTFFGPVFNSISKKGYRSVIREDFVLDQSAKKIPVIALGGINTANFEKVGKMNFDGAAVLGSLWEDPAKANHVFNELNKLNSR